MNLESKDQRVTHGHVPINSHIIHNHQSHTHQHHLHVPEDHGHQGQSHALERHRRLSQHSKETSNTAPSHQSHQPGHSDRHRRHSRFSFSFDGGDHHDSHRRNSQFRSGRRGTYRRECDIFSEATSNDLPRHIDYENTYKLVPDVSFNPDRVKVIIEAVLKENLEEDVYDRQSMSNRSLLLSEIIKEKVKQLHLPRYKIVCMVFIGEEKQQTVMISSRCLWNQSCDNFASCSYSKGNLYAVGMVFAVYQE